MLADDFRLYQIVPYGVDGPCKSQIQRAHFVAVLQNDPGLFGNLFRKNLPDPLLFRVYLLVQLFYFGDVPVNGLRRLKLQGRAHVVLIRHLQLGKIYYLLVVRMGFCHHYVELRRKVHAVIFSQLFPCRLLLPAYLLLKLPFLSAEFSQKMAELVVDIEGVEPVPSRVQLVEKVLRVLEEVFLRHGFNLRRVFVVRDKVCTFRSAALLHLVHAVGALVIPYFVLHGQLPQLPHLEKERFHLVELHDGENRASAP